MEKYGVVQDVEKTKTASTTKTCPDCGGKVEQRGNVLACEKCGTKPFEGTRE